MARAHKTLGLALLTALITFAIYQNYEAIISYSSLPISNSSAADIDDLDFPSSHLAYNNNNKQSAGQKNTEDDIALHPEKYAYASLLCDDVMIEAALVTIHSLLTNTQTRHPYIILTLPAVTRGADIEALGAKVIQVEKLDYPFPENAEKRAINKMCRYSKLHIWRFEEYKKVVFLDLDLVVMQNIDHLFHYPEISAVADAGDTFNTGVFVLEPSLSTFEKMTNTYLSTPSYNQGDQGFLNSFFSPDHQQLPQSPIPNNSGNSDDNKRAVVTYLPTKYNVHCKYQEYASWPVLKKTAKIFHLTSETKPWNFWSSGHALWKMNMESSVFYIWRKEWRSIVQKLKLDVYTDDQWREGRDRIGSVCDRIHKTFNPVHFKDISQFTVIIHSIPKADRIAKLVGHYEKSRLVKQIIVFVKEDLAGIPKSTEKVKYISQAYESVNNRFEPVDGIDTKAVLLVDDSVFPSIELIELGYASWKNQPYSLVGYLARLHYKSTPSDIDSDGSWYSTLHNTKYSWLSSALLFLPSEYLFIYTCLMPPSYHQLVESNDECRDVAFNMAFAGMTGLRPLAIQNDLADGETLSTLPFDFLANSTLATIYSAPTAPKDYQGNVYFNLAKSMEYSRKKGRCFPLFQQVFYGGKDALVVNTLAVTPFYKMTFVKRDPRTWDATYNG